MKKRESDDGHATPARSPISVEAAEAAGGGNVSNGAPSRAAVVASLAELGLPAARYPAPHCSRPADLPARPVELLGRQVPLPAKGAAPHWPGRSRLGTGGGPGSGARVTLQTVARPPSRREVERWVRARNLLGREAGAGQETIREDTSTTPPPRLPRRLRVRHDSGESGDEDSELSCSPPSPPSPGLRKRLGACDPDLGACWAKKKT